MSQTSHNSAKSKVQSVNRAYWTLLLLLPLGLLLPLAGELIQTLLIGEERVCCMPDNLDQLLARAETAKSLRWLSNLIIGGSMVIGVALVIFAFVAIYRKIIPSLSQRTRNIVLIILAIACIYVILVLVAMLLFFVFRNDYYYEYRPWPGGSLYDGAWFNPAHWLRANFANPFA